MGFLSRLGGSTLDGHFDVGEEGVHLDVHAVDGAHHDGAVLELDSHGFVLELHQESHQLHDNYYKRDAQAKI